MYSLKGREQNRHEKPISAKRTWLKNHPWILFFATENVDPGGDGRVHPASHCERGSQEALLPWGRWREPRLPPWAPGPQELADGFGSLGHGTRPAGLRTQVAASFLQILTKCFGRAAGAPPTRIFQALLHIFSVKFVSVSFWQLENCLPHLSFCSFKTAFQISFPFPCRLNL